MLRDMPSFSFYLLKGGDDLEMVNNEIIKEAKLELARRDFFFYCHLRASDFYKKDRTFLVNLCNDLQNFIESEDEVLILNLPPR